MAATKTIKVGEVDVRIHLDSGFICITDLAGVRGNASDNIKNWMRNISSINFFEAWENEHNKADAPLSFDQFRIQAADNTFTLTTTRLVEAGCSGIFNKRGRYGGTYCHIDWATHFANWLDARFYVLTLKVARELSDRVFGRDAAQLRFSRDLAAKNYGLLTQSGNQRAKHQLPDPKAKFHVEANADGNPVERFLNQMNADIINLAMWQMTALDWRTRYPPSNPRNNMRDFATTEELNTVSALQITMLELQAQNFTSEEILDRLSTKATELLDFYCDTEDKQYILEKAREQRGW